MIISWFSDTIKIEMTEALSVELPADLTASESNQYDSVNLIYAVIFLFPSIYQELLHILPGFTEVN